MINTSIYWRTMFFLVICCIVPPVHAEPMFDNNGLTTRDKLKTIGVRYGKNTQTFERVGAFGATTAITAFCLDFGLNYGTEVDESSYISASICPDVETDSGSSDDSATKVSFGYITAFPQSRGETYFESSYVSYPATSDFSFGAQQGTVEFSGLEIVLGFGLDLYDGQQFSAYVGFEIDVYIKYKNDVEKEDNYGGYLKFSYLFRNDWAIALRVAGTSTEGAAFTLMRSF